MNITAILNGYKRPFFLPEQLSAINNQSIKPKEIMMWKNGTVEFPQHLLNNITVASCNKNLGVWARFALALNATTEYICILDDDTIPGNRWFENCIQTMQTHEGLLGTIGIVFRHSSSYYIEYRVGWDGLNNTEPHRVDLVGHSWFFKREWLSTYWRELPNVEFFNSINNNYICGEDIHFSWMLKKYLGLNTYVPPHPLNDKSLWGSLKGWEYGTEPNGISMNWGNSGIEQYFVHAISSGYKIIADENK